MKYTILYNPVRKVWTVWRETAYDSVTVKSFKTEKGAQNYVAKRGGA